LSTRHAVRIRCFGVGIALGGAALLVPQLAFAHPHHTETVTKVYFTGEQDCVEGQESMLHDQFGIGTISSQAVVSRMPPPFFDIVLSCAKPRPHAPGGILAAVEVWKNGDGAGGGQHCASSNWYTNPGPGESTGIIVLFNQNANDICGGGAGHVSIDSEHHAWNNNPMWGQGLGWHGGWIYAGAHHDY